MTRMISALCDRVRRSLREFFLLESAKRTISARTQEQIAIIRRRYQAAALDRLRIADDK
jgi:hypothetical protein